MRRAETILKSQEESDVSQNDHPVVVLFFFCTHAHAHTKKTQRKKTAAAILNNPFVNPWTKTVERNETHFC
jgi:hypothetical protein